MKIDLELTEKSAKTPNAVSNYRVYDVHASKKL